MHDYFFISGINLDSVANYVQTIKASVRTLIIYGTKSQEGKWWVMKYTHSILKFILYLKDFYNVTFKYISTYLFIKNGHNVSYISPVSFQTPLALHHSKTRCSKIGPDRDISFV